MGEAGHDAAHMFVGPGDERRLERAQTGVDFLCGVAHPQTEIGRDLIIA